MTSSNLAQHLTFDEQAAAGLDANPCTCWDAGYGYISGLGPDEVQHPDEWAAGALAAFERAYDL